MEFTPTPGFQQRDEREQISAWQLLRAATGLKSAIAQMLLLSLALEVFAIATPFFLQLVVDRVLVGRDSDFSRCSASRFGALVVMQRDRHRRCAPGSASTSARSINLQLLDTLFAQLLRLPLAWFEKRHIGDIVSRFRSVDAIQRTLTHDVRRDGDGRRDGACSRWP